MASLRRAIAVIVRLGWAKRIFVDGCFIGPREHTTDVDVIVTIDPAAAWKERSEERLALELGTLCRSLRPDVDLYPIDDDLPEVDILVRTFQKDKAEHGGHEKGILQLVI